MQMQQDHEIYSYWITDYPARSAHGSLGLETNTLIPACKQSARTASSASNSIVASRWLRKPNETPMLSAVTCKSKIGISGLRRLIGNQERFWVLLTLFSRLLIMVDSDWFVVLLFFTVNDFRKPRKIQLRGRTSRRDSCAVQTPPLALIWFTVIFRGALYYYSFM